ncbi:MAG TPA: hypothetical protein VK184_09555 [Nostocaceae cyanobacterium]|nr:hypothetical protein [Nostocaceae cyanobacterium]
MNFDNDQFRLTGFDAEKLADYMGGKLVLHEPEKIVFYLFPWHNIDLYENGGEANVVFDCIPEISLYTPPGTRVARYTFDFSIPYPGNCKNREKEFAERLLFFLKNAHRGVHCVDYFFEKSFLTPIAINCEVKWKCKIDPPLPPGWTICVNPQFRFEVWYELKTKYGEYKYLDSALKAINIKP